MYIACFEQEENFSTGLCKITIYMYNVVPFWHNNFDYHSIHRSLCYEIQKFDVHTLLLKNRCGLATTYLTESLIHVLRCFRVPEIKDIGMRTWWACIKDDADSWHWEVKSFWFYQSFVKRLPVQGNPTINIGSTCSIDTEQVYLVINHSIYYTCHVAV